MFPIISSFYKICSLQFSTRLVSYNVYIFSESFLPDLLWQCLHILWKLSTRFVLTVSTYSLKVFSTRFVLTVSTYSLKVFLPDLFLTLSRYSLQVSTLPFHSCFLISCWNEFSVVTGFLKWTLPVCPDAVTPSTQLCIVNLTLSVGAGGGKSRRLADLEGLLL